MKKLRVLKIENVFFWLKIFAFHMHRPGIYRSGFVGYWFRTNDLLYLIRWLRKPEAGRLSNGLGSALVEHSRANDRHDFVIGSARCILLCEHRNRREKKDRST